MARPTEKELINSDFIKTRIRYSIDSFKDSSITIDKILLNFKNRLIMHFPPCLNENNQIGNNKSLKKGIEGYIYGILSNIKIHEDQSANLILSNLTQGTPDEILGRKTQLADILEKQISPQLRDIMLDFATIKHKLKGTSVAKYQFNILAKAYSMSSNLVKEFIIDKLERTLMSINTKNIKNIDYSDINDIEKLKLEDVLQDTQNFITQPDMILDNMNKRINNLLSAKDINTNVGKQEDLKYTLMFFKTVADYLPEIVGKKCNLPSLSSIYSSENSFFNSSSRTIMNRMSKRQLAKFIYQQYKTVSNAKFSRVDKFKTFSQLTRLLLMLLTIAVVIGIATLLIYALNHKDTVHQVLM
ncbi:hypothetical protein NEOKW01_1513 [Nematocida sp. AWRm80]|nr:hypothetical protein NEOKW01_1513 [Nematocida sp. AWRm80]